jgi:hypothetical protein
MNDDTRQITGICCDDLPDLGAIPEITRGRRDPSAGLTRAAASGKAHLLDAK